MQPVLKLALVAGLTVALTASAFMFASYIAPRDAEPGVERSCCSIASSS